MSEWKEYKLGDIALINMGQSPNSTTYSNIKIGLPFFQGNRTFGRLYPSIDTYCTSPIKTAELNDILFSVRAPVGDINYSPEKVCIGRGLCSIRMKSGNQVFLFYLLHYLKNEIINKESGTVFGSVNKAILENLIVKIPELPTQKAIAEILSSLDDKIELNNKINQELEDLAQTLFKRWFIDFEFPNENGDPYKSSGGEMVDSELGEIPKGWEVVKVSSLEYKLQTGSRPKGGVGGITSGLPSVGAESVKGLGYYDFSKVKFISKEFADKMKRGKVHGYELLIYKDGGKPGTFIPHFTMFGEGFPFDDFYINEHVFLLDFLNREFNCFCYFYFDSQYVIPIFENNGGKAAIPGINQEDVKQLCVFSPKNTLVKRFGEVAKSSIQTILQNCKENIQLTTLRDTLLPKLISGELEVSQIKNLP